MDCSRTGENKGFRYEWIIENFNHGFKKKDEKLRSPSFHVGQAKWSLTMSPTPNSNNLEVCITRDLDCQGPVSLKAVFESAFLKALNKNYTLYEVGDFRRGEAYVCFDLLLPEADQTTTFCSPVSVTVLFWMKSINDFTYDGYCLARTRIKVRKVSLDWKISNFRALEPGKDDTLPISSSENGAQCKTFIRLLLTSGPHNEKLIFFIFESHDEQVHCCNFRLSVLCTGGYTIECCLVELIMDGAHRRKKRQLFLTKERLMAQEDLYLHEGTLTLKCECAFSTGIPVNSIETEVSGWNPCLGQMSTSANHRQNATKTSPDLLSALEDWKSMYNDKSQCDVTLQTGTEIFPAHKNILCARSPVFKAMFDADMKEKTEACIHIEDFNDDTVRRMLQYMYTAAIEDLNDWESALKLYEAADKYQILSLKEKCSEFLKSQLREANVCRILVLSDMHSDPSLKSAARNFIVRNHMDIMNSTEWTGFMALHLSLAAYIMHLILKK